MDPHPDAQRSMQVAVTAALSVLQGLPLWGSHRVLDIQVFKFGRMVPSTSRKGDTVAVGEYAVHVSCAWRLVEAASVLVGSDDRFVPPGPEPEEVDVDWDRDGDTRLDERLTKFFAQPPGISRTVLGIEVDRFGGFRLDLGAEVALEVWPHGSYEEHWRLFQPGTPTDLPHFVVTGHGIQDG